MEEERLTALLQGLPRERALPGFTARVLRRLDEQPHPRRLASRADRAQGSLDLLRLLPWHRWMAATATVAALAVSVSLSQRDRTPGPFTAISQARPVKLAEAGTAGALAGPQRRLSPLPLAAVPAASRPRGAEMSQTQTEQMLHELRIGQARLERELRSLRQPAPRHAGAPTSASHPGGLGGDDALDPAFYTGRARAVQITPPADRDDGEYNYSLD
jgi:hypothetical protein